MALVGINPSRQNRWFRRVAVGPVGSTAAQAYLHLKPMATPTDVTAVQGDVYWDSTALAPAFYDGSNWRYAMSTSSQTATVLAGFKRNVLASSGNTTMTSAMSGSTMLLDSATVDYTLPAIGAGDIGMEFYFLSTVISTNQSIVAGAVDLLTGGAAMIDVGAAGTDYFAPDVSDDLTAAFNGTTTGGVAVGLRARYTAISATRWFVDLVAPSSGTAATCFS